MAMRLRTVLMAVLPLFSACTQSEAGRGASSASQTDGVSSTSSGQVATDSTAPGTTSDELSTGSASSQGTGASTDSTGSAETGLDSETTGGEGFEPITVAIVSDLNGPYGSTTYDTAVHDAVAAIVALAPDLVLSTGDMVAGQQAGLDYEAMWAGFHDAVSDPLATAQIPFAVAPGNHDASGYPAFVQEREVYAAQWNDRKPQLAYLDDTSYPFRYSFTVGSALFVALDDTTIGPLAQEQMAWIADQLEAGADSPVKIVYGHVPLYAFAQGREDEIIADPELEQLLLEHDVTMFISGHHHAYYPGRRGDLGLVGTACLGSGPRALVGAADPSPKGILLLGVSGAGQVELLDAFTGPGYRDVIARSGLPEAITVDDITIVRDDL